MTRRSGRSPDPVRVVAAQVAGTVERCVIGAGLTPGQALVEIGACLGALSTSQRQAALDYAAAPYVGEPAGPAATIAALLERAGAHLDRAREIRAERSGSFLVH